MEINNITSLSETLSKLENIGEKSHHKEIKNQINNNNDFIGTKKYNDITNIQNDKSENIKNDKSDNIKNDKLDNIKNDKSENIKNDKSDNIKNDKSENIKIAEIKKYTDNNEFTLILQYFEEFRNFQIKTKDILKNLKNSKNIRSMNFPEFISENIVKYIIHNIEKCDCINASTGDLQKIIDTNHKKIEVKCYSSLGPCSFGPTESWDEIYFLDATKYLKDEFVCYKISLSNNSDVWKNLKINAKETYFDVCKSGKRPRQNPQKIINDVEISKHCVKIYSGSFKKILDI